MVLKAYIVDRLNYKYKIRIPQYHGFENAQNAVPNSNLPYATVCLGFDTTAPYEIGDIVFVTFEDNDLDKPVIIGKLLKEGITTKTQDDLQELKNMVLQYLTIDNLTPIVNAIINKGDKNNA